MDEEEVKNVARLWTLEATVCQLWAIMYQMSPDPRAAFEATRKSTIDRAKQKKFPGLNRAMSVVAATELESAANRLLEMQKEILEKALAR